MKTFFSKYSLYILILISACILSSCNSGDSSLSPWQIGEAKENTDDQIKILLLYDMEGISGQDTLTSIDFPRPEYFKARELLTADVNAAIEGLFEGGADSVFVVDGHGSFNPEPDILLDEMDQRAEMLFKKERFHPYVDLLEENDYDGVVAIAMHSKTGGGGFCEHTVNLGTDWILNGQSVNESEILAFSWGRIDVPLIMVTGDDKLEQQLNWMDWLEYVCVKKAKGINEAELFPVDQVHIDIRESAKRSIEKLDKMKSVTLSEPVTASLRVIPPADLSMLENVPGLNYKDNTVTFEAADFTETYAGMRGLLEVAQTGYFNLAAGLFLRQGQDAFMQFKDAIFESWQAAAADTLPAETEANSPPSNPETLYFGSR